MAIEIKQLSIKSSVVDDVSTDVVSDHQPTPENFKSEIMEECRRLIQEMLSDKGQR